MAVTTVSQLAQELGRNTTILLEQLAAAGLGQKSESDKVTIADKERLLEYLRDSHGKAAERQKISLTTTSTSEIKQADATGKARTIQVERRKRRTFVKPIAAAPVEAPAAQEAAPVIDQDEIAKREAESLRQAELMRRQEEDAQKRLAKTKAGEEKATAEDEPAVETMVEKETAKTAGKTLEEAQAEAAAINKVRSETRTKSKAKAEEQATEPSEKAQAAEAAKKAKLAEEQAKEDAEKRRLKAEEEAKAIREMMDKPRKVLVAKKPVKAKALSAVKENVEEKGKKAAKGEKSSPKRVEDSTRRGKSAAKETAERDGWKSRSGGAARGRRGRASNEPVKSEPKEAEFIAREIAVPETISVADLAHKMSVKAAELIKVIMNLGQMVTINQQLDQDTALIVVEELGHIGVASKPDDPEAFLLENEAELARQGAEALPRAPVVTVMGHVDHGKTSLLDYLRRSKVAAGEAGGITQHIGAYHVKTDRGMVTFLDTPGHEAFSAMRARGTMATDIVVLVVAADDGVMPQTKEAIAHARAAELPVVVAINKMDKPDANPERVKQELVAESVIPEEYGGDVPFISVSAKTGLGMDELLENLLLQAEILELKAPVDVPASGIVIEARLDRGRGPVATALVQAGTLHKTDTILAGASYGRIRAMIDEDGKSIESAGPSIPVEILGLNDVPQAGDTFMVLSDERRAREIATFREGKYRDVKLAKRQAAKLESMIESMGVTNGAQVLSLIIKADLQGSQEALASSLLKLSTDEVRVQVVHAAVGGISESDVNLAIAANAVLIGFNVRADANARRLAESNDVQIKYYNIIYDAVDDVKAAMTGMLSPEEREEVIGTADIRNVFTATNIGTVAGCMITSGKVERSAHFRLLRDHVVVYTGDIDSVRRHKDDVKEVSEGFECGIKLKNYTDFKVDDTLEFFVVKEVARTL